MNINKVFLMGRLTADPELRVSANGNVPVIRFTIAVSRRMKKEVQFGERRSDSPSAGSVPAERKEPVAFTNNQSEGFGDIADVSDDDLPF